MIEWEDIENDEKQRAIVKVCLLNSFELYFKNMFKWVNGNDPFFLPFHKVICDKLEAMAKCYNVVRNLAICLPVGSGKTIIVEYFISWCFARNINNAFVYVSHKHIERLSAETRDIVKTPYWQSLFGHKIKLGKDSKVQWGFEGAINRTGLHAGTMGSGITGLDAGNPNVQKFSGALICDDLIDADDSRYPVARENCWQIYKSKLETRRRTPNTPSILIMQRLNTDDIIGRLKELEGEDWDVIEIPAIDEKGNSFWSDRYPVADLEKIKERTPSIFYAQYQQTPIAEKGHIIKQDWWRYYAPENEPMTGALIMTADTAYKESKTADCSCIQVWELRPGKMLMRDMLVGKWEFPQLLHNAKLMWERWSNPNWTNRVKYFYIEDKASGISLQQTLKHHIGSNNVRLWQPKAYRYPEDKVGRTRQLSWDVFKNTVYLPENNKMSEYLVVEAALFSEDMSHSHDDSVDAATIAHSIWVAHGGNK